MEDVKQHKARISERIICELPILACTTLESRSAIIVDVSIHGAQVRLDQPYPEGTQIHLDVDGDFVWARVQWAEVDRMGLKFLTPLDTGHRLARVIEKGRQQNFVAANRPAMQRGGFGRRAA